MDDLALKKIKLDMENLKRRVSDHDTLHAETGIRLDKDGKDIAMLQAIADSNQKILEKLNDSSASTTEILYKLQSLDSWAQKTYEVFEPLARYGAKIVKYSAFFVVLWHGAKWAWAKLMLFT